jgi:hypothetical protein
MANLDSYIGKTASVDYVTCMTSEQWDSLGVVKQIEAQNTHSKHPVLIQGISEPSEHFNAEVWFKFLDDSHPNFNEGDSDSIEIAKFFDRAEFTIDLTTGQTL